MDKTTIRAFFDNVLATSKASLELKERVEQDIIAGNDGFFVYWPEQSDKRGYLDEYHLVLIVAIPNKKNRDWEDNIDNYFETQA